MSLFARFRRLLLGKPKDVNDPKLIHTLSLIPLLAWVGLGADGLSSASYGPEEAFRALGPHTGLAFFLALATAFTIAIISYGYVQIIEQFPAGGGGYVVASKILGPRTGVVSGAALVVDYVLTITISVASGADAVFSFLPLSYHGQKVAFACTCIAILAILNLRGVKESVKVISPLFFAFIVTHLLILGSALGAHADEMPQVSAEVQHSLGNTVSLLGMAGALQLFVRAYSLGGGTYTGIEAISNAVPIMREPKVETAKRTMALLATSLAIMAGGIVLCYLLMHVQPVSGKTMNAVLAEKVSSELFAGYPRLDRSLVVLTLLSEGGLLMIAAQGGFVAGPRVLANMATDSFWPHRFASLSERLTMRNGVLLMSAAALSALIYTGGSVSRLVVMYSINVFATFSISNIAMAVYWIRIRSEEPTWKRKLVLHLAASLLCVTILVITALEKFSEGGWLTILITSALVILCLSIRRHYRLVGRAIEKMNVALPGPEQDDRARKLYEGLLSKPPVGEPNPENPVAIIFVGGYSALGRHTVMTLMRMLPGHFKGVAFVSVAVVDSDTFKGAREVTALAQKTRDHLQAYEHFAAALGLPSVSVTATGAEIAVESVRIVQELVAKYNKSIVVAGQLIFEDDTWWNRLLHNETAFLIQRRLQHIGIPMVVLPVRLDLRAVDPWRRLWSFRLAKARSEAPKKDCE